MKKYAIIQDNKIFIFDERWITINADEDKKGQHILIKENGDIVFGLGGKFRNLRDLGKGQNIPRDYSCELAKKLGKEHYDKIRDLIDKCQDENLKKFWQKAESFIHVGNTKEMDGAFCRGTTIHVNIEDDAVEGIFNKPYETTLHECGHAIDIAYSYLGRGGRLSTTYKSGIFGQTISDEIKEAADKFDKIAREEFKKHKTDREWLYQNNYITFSENVKIKVGLAKLPQKYSKIMAYRKFWKNVNDNEVFEDTINLRDIVGGVTRNKIGSGHSTAYWNKRDRIWGKNGGVALEAFAEFTSSTLTNPKSLNVLKKYLPKSYKIYQELLKEAASKV